jgi:hypothetical protein
MVTQGGGLAVVFKHFEMAPGAGWEVVEGQEVIAFATRSPKGKTSIQPLGQSAPPETPSWPGISYWRVMDETADVLAVLSETQGQIRFSHLPLGE